MTSPHRFPDLTGKAVIAVGVDESLLEVIRALAVNAMLIVVVAPDRNLVSRSVEVAESLSAVVNGFTVDPADPAVWQRIAPHIEQRLGPIDVAIVAAGAAVRTVVVDAVRADMLARKRGVIIEIDHDLDTASELGDAIRHHAIDAALSATEIAAAVTRLASDRPAVPSNGPESTVWTTPNG